MLVAGCAAAVLALAAAQPLPQRRAHLAMAPLTELRDASTSENWAGYTVTAPGASFVDVKGTWIEPSVDCTTSGASASGFWIGFGGLPGATALEQTGTAADCDASGHPSHYAWYELVPAPPSTVPLEIGPGDTISAEVRASGTTISFQLDDLTNGHSFSTQTTVAHPDLSSAEWIAEAPSACSPFNPNGCTVMPLSNFGTFSFTAGSAAVADHTGPIADPAWSVDRVQLVAATGDPVAQPSDLGSDGSSFTITWQSTGGLLRLMPLGFTTTPQLPRAGRPFTASLKVAATNPAALADATTTCSAVVAGRPVRALGRSFSGRAAQCVWQLSAGATGKTIAGTVTVTARGAKLSKPFSLRIR